MKEGGHSKVEQCNQGKTVPSENLLIQLAIFLLNFIPDFRASVPKYVFDWHCQTDNDTFSDFLFAGQSATVNNIHMEIKDDFTDTYCTLVVWYKLKVVVRVGG